MAPAPVRRPLSAIGGGLQEQDAGAEINITIEVTSQFGIPEATLNDRIVEGLDQLGIEVRWEEG